MASISLQVSDPWVPFVGTIPPARGDVGWWLSLISVHHILWYAPARRQGLASG